MKQLIYLSLILLSFIMPGCSGSDVYRGNWKAMDRSGNKWDISFDAKSFTLKNAKGESEQYGYSQTSIRIENSTRSYGIKLKDGRAFRITFPLPGNTSKGIINNESTNEALYTIGRNNYVEFMELLKF